MYMLTFTVIAISILGLFFQILTALNANFATQQVAVGEQLLNWHQMAVDFACINRVTRPMTLYPDSTVSDPTFKHNIPIYARPANGVAGTTSAYTGWSWNTVVAPVTFGTDTTPTRTIVTYVPPGSSFAGYSSAEITRQLTANLQWLPQIGKVQGAGAAATITTQYYTGSNLPAELQVAGTTVVISQCP